jgi:hypothetical protein
MNLWRIASLSCAVALFVSSGATQAHDTWFEKLTSAGKGQTVFALGTGNRFPLAETPIDPRHFVKSGCQSADGKAGALELDSYTEHATVVRVSSTAATNSCFVQLEPFDVELAPDRISVYFKEIRPSAAALSAWADLKARGLPFRERYTKSARIDLGARASQMRSGTTMDVLRTAPIEALTVGTQATFQVLREGRPLADFPVELVNERSPIGLWYRTDSDGRIEAKLPLPGRWLLRGTDLRLSSQDPTRWESQFITYAFDVSR